MRLPCITGGSIGRCALYSLNTPANVNQHVCILRVNENLVGSNLLHSIVTSKIFQAQIDASQTGSGREGLNFENLGNFNLVIPPIIEQTTIANYLDSKTKTIDALIKKTEQKIELLKEQRTAIINQAVTCGLDEDGELRERPVSFPAEGWKDSGVEWIGKYPDSWECVKLIRVTKVSQGLQIPISKRLDKKVNGSYEYITTKSVHNPSLPKQYILDPPRNVICKKNDILFGRTGNTGEIVTGVDGVFHNNFFLVSINETKLNKDFVYWYFSNPRFREYILLVAGTTTIPDLNHGDFYETLLLIPTKFEQIQIVEFIKKKIHVIESFINIYQSKTTKLKEYRQSLISEVVTGKIKVTD